MLTDLVVLIMELNSEQKIVNAVLEGRVGAARRFYTQFNKAVKYYVCTRVKSWEDTEEIVQEVFLSAIESMGLYSGRSKLITWLYGIARHEISDYYRKKRVKTLVMSHVPMLQGILGDENWEDKYNLITIREQVKEVMGKILPRYALVLRMKYLEGWSVGEIADKLNESFKATETALFRARKAFAIEWESLCENDLIIQTTSE